MLWGEKDDGSLKAMVGAYKIYISSFHALRGDEWLVDEVIDAYINHIITEHQNYYYQISACAATALFSGQISMQGKMKFPVQDIWVCPINISLHWLLVIVVCSQKRIILRDPLGNEKEYLSILKPNWSLFLHKYSLGEQVEQWKIVSMPHNKQQDGSSCGVLILMFVRDFIKKSNIMDVKTTPEYIQNARLEIACTLLKYEV